ncbi:MAG: flippase [Ignavibacteriales bacterium]|nr:flippase [Ignavibacteriales bacterium]
MISYKIIFKNILSLSVSELIGRMLNFVSFALLARIILPDGFGIINFAFSFASYFLLVVNFGFDTTGTREIAQSRCDPSEYVSKLISLRLLLAVAGYFFLITVIYFVKIPSLVKTAVSIYGLSLFTNALLINWFYKGIEKTLPISIAQIVSALANLLGIIFFVHLSHDLLTAVWIVVFSSFLNAVILLAQFYKSKYKLSLRIDKIFFYETVRNSSPIGLSYFLIGIYYNLDQVMLGFMSSQSDLGYYSAAYKIFYIVIIPASIILNAFFPQMSRFSNDFEKLSQLLGTYSKLMFIAGFFICFFGLLNAETIIHLIFGGEYFSSVLLLKLLFINTVLVFINMTYGNPLLAWNRNRQYLTAIALGAVINVVLNFILIPAYKSTGAAAATICSEAVVFGGVFYYYRKYTGVIHFPLLAKVFMSGLISYILAAVFDSQKYFGLLNGFIFTVLFILFLILSKVISFRNFKSILQIYEG